MCAVVGNTFGGQNNPMLGFKKVNYLHEIGFSGLLAIGDPTLVYVKETNNFVY